MTDEEITDVFSLLRDIRARPEMYLGGDARDRRSQLQTLESVLYGYGYAMKVNGLNGPGRRLVRQFAEHLRERFGWPSELGPVSAVIDGVGDGEDPWERFWELIEEYGQHVGQGSDERE